MVHVLETGLEYMEIDNPNGKPAVRGYNIINGQLTSASDKATFRSSNPALLADCLGAVSYTHLTLPTIFAV